MQGSNSNKDVVPVGSSSRGGRCHAYKGVRRWSSRKYLSEIYKPRKQTRIWLGTFTTPEMMGVAYEVAALALKGREAELNFPNSATSLPAPASSSPRDIQAAAARAASAVGAAWDHLLRNATAQGGNSSLLQLANAVGNDEFVDEEMIFNMPNIPFNMAEGMPLSPPLLDVEVGTRPSAVEINNEGNQPDDLWKFPLVKIYKSK